MSARPIPEVSAASPGPALRWMRKSLVRGFRRLGAHSENAILHLIFTIVVYGLAFELRFDFATPPSDLRLFWLSLPLLIVLRLTTYAVLGVFRPYLLHYGVQDLLTLAQGVTLSSLAFVLVLTVAGLFPGVPRSVLLLEWAGAIFVAGGIPFIARSLREARVPFATPRGRRTLVVGTGWRAEQLIRETRREPDHALNVVALVDLTGSHCGRTIRGVRVLGSVAELTTLVKRTGAEFAIIALDPTEASDMRRVVDQCIAAELEFKTLPSLHEWLDNTAGVKQLRDVRMEDLLGRRAVTLDLSSVESDIRDRVVLLTGAAGSIGSELARQIAPFHPSRLILLDQAESDLYFVHLELRSAHPDLEVLPVICDITNPDRLGRLFAQYRPDYVLHAAAYKHVPLMESNVVEAVRNNVLGTLLVASAAARQGARKMLLISTDKAINPSSVMGASKRISERIIFGLPALRDSGTDFRAVRFGNVLASNGSVIPLFERQLAAGGPLTVTDPCVQRYFMTIPEAVQLVLQAGSLPETARAITMLDMGEPVRILDLAEKLIRFSGRVPGRDVRIVFTGLRPGEKLTEELISSIEATVPTSTEKIRISQLTENGNPELERGLSRLLTFLERGDRDGMLATICDLVPECVAPLRSWLVQRCGDALNPRHATNGSGLAPSTGHLARAAQHDRRGPGEAFSSELGTEWVDRRSKKRRSGAQRRHDDGSMMGEGPPRESEKPLPFRLSDSAPIAIATADSVPAHESNGRSTLEGLG